MTCVHHLGFSLILSSRRGLPWLLVFVWQLTEGAGLFLAGFHPCADRAYRLAHCARNTRLFNRRATLRSAPQTNHSIAVAKGKITPPGASTPWLPTKTSAPVTRWLSATEDDRCSLPFLRRAPLLAVGRSALLSWPRNPPTSSLEKTSPLSSNGSRAKRLEW